MILERFVNLLEIKVEASRESLNISARQSIPLIEGQACTEASSLAACAQVGNGEGQGHGMHHTARSCKQTGLSWVGT